jgi:hypothetical protein
MLASGSGTVVEQSLRHLKVKGSSPATTTTIRMTKIVKIEGDNYN